MLAWGRDNSEGGLGDGGMTSTTGAVQVSGLTNASQVSAGGQFSLAVHVVPWVALPPQSSPVRRSHLAMTTARSGVPAGPPGPRSQPGKMI